MDIPTNLELTGMCFFQGSPEKKYLGVLEYNPFEGKHTLTLYGIALEVEKRIPCVNGEIAGGKKASIFDSVVEKNVKNEGSGELASYTVLSYLNFLIGDSFFFSKDEVCFHRLSFRCSNLAQWLNYSPFQPISQEKKKGFVFNKKESVTIFENNTISIQLQFLMNYNSSDTEVMMKYVPNILIKTKSNYRISYWGEENSFRFYMQVVFAFFALVIGRRAFRYDECGTIFERCDFSSKDSSDNSNGKSCLDIHEANIYHAGKYEHEWFESMNTEHILLPYSFVKDSIKPFFESFAEHYQLFDHILSDWVMIKNLSSYSIHSLPILLFNLEGLHESLFPNNRPLGCKKDDNVPYASRLHDIFFNCLDGLFSFLTREQFEVIIKDIVSIRRQDAHAKKRQHFSWGYQFNLILLVEFAIYFLILKQTYQLESNFLNRSALGWKDLQRDLPVLLDERMNSPQ